MQTLTDLLLWHDYTPRSGAMNMAVDQLLLETIHSLPVLRFYSWDRPSISLGYFDSLTTARASFADQNLDFIRRWTGGGIVDHCIDLTYTLAIPRQHPLAVFPGAESYRLIHQAVAVALKKIGVDCKLETKNSNNDTPTCFTNPVTYDIITPDGKKLAGAGQKRTRHGLLHQGSVIGVNDIPKWQQSFTEALTESTIPWTPEVSFFSAADELVTSRYGTQAWLNKRI